MASADIVLEAARLDIAEHKQRISSLETHIRYLEG
jgi:hypothetical protein